VAYSSTKFESLQQQKKMWATKMITLSDRIGTATGTGWYVRGWKQTVR